MLRCAAASALTFLLLYDRLPANSKRKSAKNNIRTEDVCEKILSSVFKVVSPFSVGTGFVIGHHGTALTAGHMATPSRSLRAEFEDGTEYEIDVIHSNATVDFALIHLRGAYKLNPLQFGSSSLIRRGE